MPTRILIPVANPMTAEELIRLGAAMLDKRAGELSALGIVEVPEGMPLSEGATRARHAPKHRRSESHTHAPDQAWNGTNWLSSALGVATARPVLSLSVLGTAFCAAICLPVFGSFSSPPPQPIKVAVHAYGLPEVAGEPCTLLDGQITCQVGQGRFRCRRRSSLPGRLAWHDRQSSLHARVFRVEHHPQKLPPMQLTWAKA
jgi:hypothetical protein